MDCIFCKIANKEIESNIVYEDKDFIAFLDINPVNKGHVLVIPKKHYPHFLDVDDELMKEYSIVIKRIANSLQKALGCDFINIVMYGVDVAHAHVHIIPRYKDDGLHFFPHKKYQDDIEARAYRDKIKKQLEQDYNLA